MEDDASNDVEAVEYIDSQDEDDPDGGEKRPIMLLLRRLIKNKQNTVMTNAQIIDILQSEFNISVGSSHELEVDIYIKIIKHYLKDWPQWEELERISTKLSNIKDFEAVNKVLNHKYKNLKEYLGVMLEAAKPLAKEAVKNVTPETPQVEENLDSSDVVMEIQCTREQLNHLFFRRPRLDLNNTIFNISNVPPQRISLKHLSFDDILNMWGIKVSINLPHFVFSRQLTYILKHGLVNKARDMSHTQDTVLETLLQMQLSKKSKTELYYTADEIMKVFGDILEECVRESYEIYAAVHSIFQIATHELKNAADDFRVPANYRRFANKHKYVRYLCAENKNNDDKRYDLRLEESMSPVYQYYIGRIGKLQTPLPLLEDWLQIECLLCKQTLPVSVNIKQMLEAHYNDLHQTEQKWQCLHCQQVFSADFLAKHKWSHDC